MTSPQTEPPRTYALLSDLFFRAKIEAMANAVGAPVTFSATLEDLENRLPERPAEAAVVVIVDLGDSTSDPLGAIRALKAHPAPPIVLAYGSHRDRDALKAAREAGADEIMARSTFVERLPVILQRERSS